MNQLNKSVYLADDIPDNIKQAIIYADIRKFRDSEKNELIQKANELLIQNFKYMGMNYDIAEMLPKRNSFNSVKTNVFSVTQDIANLFNSVDWTFAKNNTKKSLVIVFNRVVSNWIKNNIPLVK